MHLTPFATDPHRLHPRPAPLASSRVVSNATVWTNGGILNATLAKLQPGDTWVVPNKTFYVMGGVIVSNLRK
jgi:hypothetical protein